MPFLQYMLSKHSHHALPPLRQVTMASTAPWRPPNYELRLEEAVRAGYRLNRAHDIALMRVNFDHVVEERPRLARAEETIQIRKALACPHPRGGGSFWKGFDRG